QQLPGGPGQAGSPWGPSLEQYQEAQRLLDGVQDSTPVEAEVVAVVRDPDPPAELEAGTAAGPEPAARPAGSDPATEAGPDPEPAAERDPKPAAAPEPAAEAECQPGLEAGS